MLSCCLSGGFWSARDASSSRVLLSRSRRRMAASRDFLSILRIGTFQEKGCGFLGILLLATGLEGESPIQARSCREQFNNDSGDLWHHLLWGAISNLLNQ